MKSGAIAVVGMGCRFPGSPHLAGFWETIRQARICAAPVPRDRWNHDLFYSPTGAREANKTYARSLATLENVRSFAPEFFGLTPRRAKVMDPQQRLFLDAVRTAFEDAGYALRPFPRARTGVFVGGTVSDFMDILTARVRAWQIVDGEFGRSLALDEASRQALNEDLAPMQAYSMVGSLMNMVAANVNQCFDLGGPAFTMDAACSSALVAVHEAVWQLRAGLVDAAVAGGAFCVLTPDNMVAFARIGALSPSDACRPYDGRADGFVIGEGIGAIILRRLEDAQAAGDRIYAVIRGIASNSDGKSDGPMTPRREGQLRALEGAYQDAGVAPHTIGLLEGHGTATPVGDATEIAAFRDCLGAHVADCALGSVKANIGHTMAAAGIAGLIKAILALRQRVIPPQANYETPRPELELERAGLYIAREERAWSAPVDHPRRAGVNAFGFGGTNVHVVLEEAPVPSRRSTVAVPAGFEVALSARPRPELVVLSAPTPALLVQAAEELVLCAERMPPEEPIADLAYTLAARRIDEARLAVVAADAKGLALALRAVVPAIASGSPLADGAFYAAAPRTAEDRRIAFLFPGQGLQNPGLCRDLYERFPLFRCELEALASATEGLLPRPLLSYLYPADDVPDAASALTATDVCQPALAAVALAMARFVRGLGVDPTVVAGHSLGELVAAAASGLVADEAAFVGFLAERGRLIAETTAEDPGCMTAVAADASAAAQAIEGLKGVVLANLNHPRQTVLSGTTAGIAAVEQRLTALGLRFTRLRVSHAFHSPLMGPAAARLGPLVERLPIGPAVVPTISAIRPGPLPEDPAELRAHFVEHTTARVDFVGALAACAARGVQVFLQLGAGSALAGMATANLGADVAAFTLAPAAPDEADTFLRALARLFTLGVPLRLDGLFEGRDLRLVDMLPPSRLDARPLWPVARKDTTHPPLTLSREVTKQPMDEKKSDLPSPLAGEPGGTDLAALFRQQMAVIDSHLAIIRQQNELLARGASPDDERQGIPVSQSGNGYHAHPERMNGHKTFSEEASNGSGHSANGAPAHAVTANGSNGFHGSAHAPEPLASERPASANGSALPVAGVRPNGRGETPSLADLESKIVQVVSRITAHPPDRLRAHTKLGADLGFDSLMVVELVSGLQELVPDAEPLSRSLFAEDVSIGDVARHLSRSVEGRNEGARPDDHRTAPSEVSRYVVTYEARPLVTATDSLTAPVVIIGEADGLAEALHASLTKRGVGVRLLGEPSETLPPGATVIDLRGLAVGSDLLEPAAFSAPVLDAFELVRGLDGARPAVLLLAHRGVAGSGLGGFAKALGREWAESRVLAVSLGGAVGAAAANLLLAELTGGATAAEVAYAGDERRVPVLRPAPLPADGHIPKGAVVAIAGGAAGLGARLARELARVAGARLILLGRRPQDEDTNAVLADVRAAGGSALYVPCDVRDPAAVALALAEGRRAFGPIQLAVHAAGILEDAPIGRKDRESFVRVFETKVAGALALWKALAGDPVSVFLLYGSWAGRFGNAFQTDYAAANHVLGRLSEALSADRPRTRVVTLDLPPWENSGMVASLPQAIQQEMRAQGVPFLTDRDGLDRVLSELRAAGAPSGEALLAADGVEHATPAVLRTRLTPASQPYLEDHRIGDRPVLPMAAAVELLLDAVRAAGQEPGVGLISVRDLSIVKGIILADGAAEVVARATPEGRGALSASAELLALGARASVAYRARIVRVPSWRDPVAIPQDGGSAPRLSLGEFYGRHTFHGPRLRAVEEVRAVATGHAHGVIATGSDPALTWLRAVDGALQLCAYWAVVHHGRIGLPVGVGELRFLAPVPPNAHLTCRAVLRRSEGDRFEGDLDLLTTDGTPVVQLRGLRADLIAALEAPPVDPAQYRVEEFPEVKELRAKIDFAKAAGIEIPYFRTLDACTGATALIDGRELVNFTSYNYVGLSGHPQIAEAVTAAVKRYGTSVSASRVTGGQKPIHAELEAEISRFLGTEAALVMVGGHATNVSVIGHLLTADDLVLHDSLAHDSILGGARLAGARRRPFPHNDHQALERILREVRSSVRRVLIAVEGVYSMDGDIAPLPEVVALKKKYGALLLVDEAHSLGVLGATGRGAGEHFGVDRRDVDIWMGTMSKTLASCGGYIAGSAALVEYLKYTVPGFIYSVGMTPANAAAALTALRLLAAEPERARRCQERSRAFLRLCRERGVDTGPSESTAVVPAIVGNSYACIRLAEALLKRGVHVHPIIYPAVAESQARLRFFVTAAHTEEQLRFTAAALADELGKLKVVPSREASVRHVAAAETAEDQARD